VITGIAGGIERPRRLDVHPDHLAAGHLPAQHGYSFRQTPLWAGIAMLPLTIGFLAAGPVSGALSDRSGARLFTTGGMIITAVSFLLPVNFAYWQFALILLLAGAGQGLFSAPNRAAIMNSLPPERRGAGSGMTATFQNSATVLSIGIFFTLIILGLAATLPSALSCGLTAQGVPPPAPPASSACPRCRSCSLRCSAITRSAPCSARPSPTCPPPARPT
jgi:MFS family permease